MHPYLPYLLADIASAHRVIPTEKFHPHSMEETSLEQNFAEIDRWVAGENLHTFAHYCGLQPLDFPPAEQLKNDDLLKVCEAFKQMMLSWNLGIDLPDDLPLSMKYTLMVDLLNTETVIPTNGTIVFDFCTGYAPECDLKSYCPCLKFWDEIDEEIPFDMDSKANGTRGEHPGNGEEDELPF